MIAHEHFLAGILEDMVTTFGGRAYSKTQIEILSGLVDLYGRENFRKVAMRLIELGTRKPYPIDFKNALQNLSHHDKPKSLTASAEYEIKCTHCYDTGYVFLKKDFVEYLGNPVVALCKCLKGRQNQHEGENLPRIDLQGWGFVDVFPVDFFKPARRSEALKLKSGTDSKSNFQNIVQKWTLLKKQSREFWANQNKTANKKGGLNV